MGSGETVVVLGDWLRSHTTAIRWHDEDGAAAGIALEPVDTHNMSRRCAVLNHALSGHQSLSLRLGVAPP